MQIISVWKFTQASSGVYQIQINSNPYNQSITYMTAANSCAGNNTPCMSSTSYNWFLSPPPTANSTKPFTTTLQAVGGGQFNDSYLSEICSGQTPCMGGRPSSPNWTIIPVVAGS
jgi:hypothetical protein